MSIKRPTTFCSATALAVCSVSVQARDAEPSATVIVEGAREPHRNDAASLDKFTEAERDTPQSIATMTRDAMDDRAVDSINEALSRAWHHSRCAVPKLPRADAMFRGKVILDSADMRRLTADLSQPIAEHAAFRINAMNHQSTVADRDGGESRRYGVAPALTLGLGTRTRFTAHYLHQRADDVPDYGPLPEAHHPRLLGIYHALLRRWALV